MEPQLPGDSEDSVGSLVDFIVDDDDVWLTQDEDASDRAETSDVEESSDDDDAVASPDAAFGEDEVPSCDDDAEVISGYVPAMEVEGLQEVGGLRRSARVRRAPERYVDPLFTSLMMEDVNVQHLLESSRSDEEIVTEDEEIGTEDEEEDSLG